MSTKQFLILPDDIDASQYYYERDQKAAPSAIKIAKLSAAFFSPGTQYDPCTALIRADGSSTRLYYQAESGSRGTSPNAHQHHRALISVIEAATEQKLIETGEQEQFDGTAITNLNPAYALGFLHRKGNLSVFVKGLSTDHQVENKSVHEPLITDIMDAIQDSHTLDFNDNSKSTLTVSKPSIRAVWQNFGAVFLLLDGMQKPTQLPIDRDRPKTADRIIDEIVAASGNLEGARLGKDMMRNKLAFFARPQDIAGVKIDGPSLKIDFAQANDVKADSYTTPKFLITSGVDQVARKLILALD